MKKTPFVIFGIFAAIFVVLLPYWALDKEGGSDASPARVAASDEKAKVLFQTNCGACHTLEHGGTDGVVGPNLDDLLGAATTPEAVEGGTIRVRNAIENGIGGRMPAAILSGAQAKEVADFVARVAGQ